MIIIIASIWLRHSVTALAATGCRNCRNQPLPDGGGGGSGTLKGCRNHNHRRTVGSGDRLLELIDADAWVAAIRAENTNQGQLLAMAEKQ